MRPQCAPNTAAPWRRTSSLLALLLLCLATRAAVGQTPSPVEISARVDRSSVGLGETVVLTVDVTYPPTGEIQLPPADKLDFAPFEVRDAVMTPLPASGGRKHARYTVRLAAYDTGKQTIPSMQVRYKAGDGTSQEAGSAPIALEVGAPAPTGTDKPGEIRDLKALDDVPTPPWMITTAIGAGVLALALLVGATKLVMRRLRRRPPAPLAPHDQALAALEQLLEARLVENGQWKAHYERLATILREYLAARFAIPFLEHTTAEVVGMMRARDLEEWLCTDVRTVLEEADLVKFARLQVATERATAQVQAARSIVERTIPPPPPPAGSRGQGAGAVPPRPLVASGQPAPGKEG